MAIKVAFEGKRELRWLIIEHCLVTYMEADIEYADELWDEWLEAVRHPSVETLMLCSWGPTNPSHQQWRRATRLMREREIPVFVVTEARHNLALAKAASWLGTNIQAQRWEMLHDAIAQAGLREQHVAAKAKIIALRDRFGAVTRQAPAVEPEVVRPAPQPAPKRSILFDTDGYASSAMVMENSEEIQRRLAEVQARFRKSSGPLKAARARTGTDD